MQSTSDTNNKVSVKQLIIVIIVMTISPAVRFLPAYAAKNAAEAGWITPWAAIPPIIATIYFIHNIFKNYQSKSTCQIIKDILGKYIGTAALLVHFAWILLLTSFYLRFSAERLVSSIYPNIDINYFIVITIIVISYILRSGETSVARMGEILLPILLIVIAFIMLLLIPKIRADALLPISFSDTLPILKGSVGTLSIFSYMFIVFFFSENIVGKQNIKKLFIKGTFVLQVMIFMVLFTSFGILGSSVIIRAPIPFLVTVKQISIADTIENFESVAVATWMLSDAVLISTMFFALLNLAKGTFKLSNTKSFINIVAVLLFLLSNSIAKNRLELDIYAITAMVGINIALGFGTPVLLFVVGKLRHKI